MRKSIYVFSASALAVITSGCATKDFGRLAPVSHNELVQMDCLKIESELLKVKSFNQDVDNKSKIDALSILAFINDAGIGNALAKSSAHKSANLRYLQLQEASIANKCDNHSLKS